MDLKSLQFCTYFDKNYLIKGLAMYRSLQRCLDNFVMWILCFDEFTFAALGRLQLENARLISLSEFENGDDALLTAKKTRTPKEYCWTVTPSLPLFVLKKNPDIESVTYLDADLLFFSDPRPIYTEFEGKSILVIKHRYSPRYSYFEELSGIYNVALLAFRNDKHGVECLRWWRDRCNEWCYCRMENGKFGDQKYLDGWTERFHDVVVLQHKGANLAPWNIDNYVLRKSDGRISVDDDELIFFHYHGTSQTGPANIELPKGYNVTKQYIDFIYRPYTHSLHHALQEIKGCYPDFCYGIAKAGIFQRARMLFAGKICSVPVCQGVCI